MSNRQHPARRDVLLGAAAAAAAVTALPTAAMAAARKAPQWEISEWINGDGGNIDTLRGKIIVIDFFQLWCPGCNKFSGPLMKYWQQKFAAEMEKERLVQVKIHTVFEGHSYQTVKRLKGYVKEKDITVPVGVDRHIDGQRLPETMRRYNTRGTPEMAIIDGDGMIRFQEFGYFEPAKGEAVILEALNRARA